MLRLSVGAFIRYTNIWWFHSKTVWLTKKAEDTKEDDVVKKAKMSYLHQMNWLEVLKIIQNSLNSLLM